MKQVSMIIYILLFYSAFSSAQTEIQELRKSLSQANDLKKKTELYRELANAFYDVNLDSVEYYAEKSFQYGLNFSDSLSISDGLHQLGVIQQKKGNMDSSLTLLYFSLKLREQFPDKERLSSSCLEIGNSYIKKGMAFEVNDFCEKADIFYVKSQKNYLRALNAALESKDSISISKAYKNLGSVYDRLYDYEHAIINYQMAYDWCDFIRKPDLLPEIKMKILSSEFELGVLDKDSAYAGYQELLAKYGDTKIDLITFGSINFAVIMWDEDKRITEECLVKADSLAFEFGNIDYQITANKYLSDFYQEQEEFAKALNHLEKYNKLNNKAFIENSQTQIEEYKLKYNNEKFQKELKEEELISANEREQKQKLSTTLYGTITLLIVMIVFFLQRQRISRLKRKAIEKRHYQEINSLLINQELESVEAMLDGQEKERKRIAVDLHDRLGSTLAAARMYFEYLAGGHDQSNNEKSNKAIGLLDQAINETREIANDLVSGVLSKFGIIVALTDLKNTIEGTGRIKVKLNFNVQIERFQSEAEIHLYRIIQEAFSNSLKHGNVDELAVHFNQHQNEFAVKITDNGSGFNPEEVSKGMGLKNIKARVAKLNGKMTLNSNRKGTVYSIEFNIKPNEN